MPASAGTPTVLQKIAAVFGFGAAIGMTPDEIAATQAGDARDLTAGEQVVLGLFAPILNAAEGDGVSDLAAFLKALLGALPSVTSVGQAVNIVSAALEAEAGTLQKQAISIGQSGLITLISAGLSAVGKTNLPLVG